MQTSRNVAVGRSVQRLGTLHLAVELASCRGLTDDVTTSSHFHRSPFFFFGPKASSTSTHAGIFYERKLATGRAYQQPKRLSFDYPHQPTPCSAAADTITYRLLLEKTDVHTSKAGDGLCSTWDEIIFQPGLQALEKTPTPPNQTTHSSHDLVRGI